MRGDSGTDQGLQTVSWRALPKNTFFRIFPALNLILPLFVFLPKIIPHAMSLDMDVVLDAFGRNEQTKKVF